MPTPDTFFALATPNAESALAVVRLSGPDCRELVQSAFARPLPSPRVAHLGRYRLRSGEALDQMVAIWYAAPASFTGQDMLELFPHGNPFILGKLLQDLRDRGCRQADPGEFTRTAFLEGKIDLSQAEAVMDVIRARSDHALRLAQAQLEGRVGRTVDAMIDALLEIVAHLEAYIDFPEEDLPPDDPTGPICQAQKLWQEMLRLAETAPLTQFLQEGIRTVLAGWTNAGKSSLLNALLGEDRALVSPEPGTTRDYIEVRLNLGPYLLRVIDTAGLNPQGVGIEQMGIARTRQQLERADLVLWVVDRAHPPPPLSDDLQHLIQSRPTVLVENKADLPPACGYAGFLPQLPRVTLSALTGEGVDQLRQAVHQIITGNLCPPPPADAVMVSARHAGALRQAADHLRAGLALLQTGEATELAAGEWRLALASMGEITGRIDPDRILDHLFARFCIGK